MYVFLVLYSNFGWILKTLAACKCIFPTNKNFKRLNKINEKEKNDLTLNIVKGPKVLG